MADGQTVAGGYIVGQMIAAGGMGAVYRATQPSQGRSVALKFLHPHLAQNEGILARFRREAMAAAQLSHARILPVIDFRLQADPPFMVMPLLEGRSLQELYSHEGTLPWARMARIAAQLCEALEVAHGAGLVHRDIKPANLYLTSPPGVSDEALLLDFGVAKLKESDEFDRLTRTGELIGTPLFMAPEQARGEKIDGRADLYAMGLVSYALVSGRLPFPSDNPAALLVAIQNMEPAPLAEIVPGIDPNFSALIQHAIQKEPAERFQTAAEMRAALLPFAAHAHELPTTEAMSSIQQDMSAPTEIMEARALPPAPQPRGPQRTAEWQGSVVPPEPAPRAPQRTAAWQGSVAPPAPSFAAPPPVARRNKFVLALGAMLFVLTAAVALGFGWLYTEYRAEASSSPTMGVTPIPVLPPPMVPKPPPPSQ